MINVRAKGVTGEQQVAKLLNAALDEVLSEGGWPEGVVNGLRGCIQRNQNQSAVGGCDLSNVFGLAIEVKRQEELAVEAWWAQCVASAARNHEFPVLLYRQNSKKWRAVLYGSAPVPAVHGVVTSVSVRVTVELDDFLRWFRAWVRCKLMLGEYPRV